MGNLTSFNLQPTTENYISTVDFINKRNIDPKLYEKYPGQGIIKLWDITGRKSETTNPKYEWAEEDSIFKPITVSANVAAPGAGNTLTITIASADHDSTGKRSYPRKHQTVIMPNKKVGQITAKSTAVDNAHTITIKPLRSTDDLGAVLASDKIIVYGNAFPEGSDQADGLTAVPLTYSNVAQIMKEDYKITSTQDKTIAWFEVEGKDGEKAFKWGIKGEKDTFRRFQTYVGLTMLVGEKADASYTNGDGEVTRTTQGLLPFVRSGGNTFAATGFTMTSMDNLIKKLDKQKGAKENLFLGGIDIMTNIDNMLTAAMKNDVSNYEFFGAPGSANKVDEKRQRAAMFGFDHFKKSSYTFHFQTLPEFNEDGLLGTAGYGYSNTAVIIPTDKRAVTVNGVRTEDFALSIKYMPGRDYEHWVTGGGTGLKIKTGTVDQIVTSYRCEKGFQGIGANRFAIIED
jgi:hypothetical protein